MKLIAAMAGAGVVAGGVHYSGVLDRGEVYDKPYSVVYAELVSMPVPPAAESVIGGEVSMTQAPDQIAWHFRNKQGEIAVFTARLTREDDRHTRVKIGFDVGDALDDSSSALISTDLIRSTARSAMTEQIDARLSGRAYDNRRMAEVLGEHLRDHPEELKQYGESISRMYDGIAEQMKAEGGGSFSYQSSPGYAAASTQSSMAKATRPSVVLTPQ